MATSPVQADAAAPTDGGLLPGVFVCGRQHSGNSLLTLLIGRFEDCLSTQPEGVLFEHRARLDQLPDAAARAQWVGQHLYLEQPELEQQIAGDLTTWANEHPQADAIAVFQHAMSLSAIRLGKHFWARKATSYVFHIEQILARMPNVKIVYMLRNPFDVCASKKRREPRREHVVGWAMSWNRGVQLAQRYQQLYPQRVHILSYEKLVTQPEQTVRGLCRFLGKVYDPKLLDVPHINPSENPYQIVAGSKGPNRSRVYYYTCQLTSAEIAAMGMVCSGPLVRELYPDLPHLGEGISILTRMKAIGLIGLGTVRYPLEIALQARRYGMPVGQYLLRRFAVLLQRRKPAKPQPEPAARWHTLRPALAGMIALVLGLIMALAQAGCQH